MYGVARDAISGLALTAENYGTAVDVLKQRFGNPQDVIRLHYDKFVNLLPASL